MKKKLGKIIVSEDEQSAVYVSSKGNTTELKSVKTNSTCLGCFLSNFCNEEPNITKCVNSTRKDECNIIWKKVAPKKENTSSKEKEEPKNITSIFQVAPDHMSSKYIYSNGDHITLYPVQTKQFDCLNCHLVLPCNNGLIPETKCIANYRHDNKDIIWRTDEQNKPKKEEVSKPKEQNKKEFFEVSVDHQKGVYTDNKGTKFNLKVVLGKGNCSKCFFNGICDSSIKHYCCGPDRVDNMYVSWVEDIPEPKAEFIVAKDHQSGILYNYEGKKEIHLKPKPHKGCDGCYFMSINSMSCTSCKLAKGEITIGNHLYCSSLSRSDNNNIIWIEEKPKPKIEFKVYTDQQAAIFIDEDGNATRLVAKELYYCKDCFFRKEGMDCKLHDNGIDIQNCKCTANYRKDKKAASWVEEKNIKPKSKAEFKISEDQKSATYIDKDGKEIQLVAKSEIQCSCKGCSLRDKNGGCIPYKKDNIPCTYCYLIERKDKENIIWVDKEKKRKESKIAVMIDMIMLKYS